MPQSLVRFQIHPEGDAYRLQFVTQDDVTIELLASFDQLDLLAEEIDRRLDADEEADQDEDAPNAEA